MKDALKPGMTFEFKYTVPENKTVPHLFPDIAEAQAMPTSLTPRFKRKLSGMANKRNELS